MFHLSHSRLYACILFAAAFGARIGNADELKPEEIVEKNGKSVVMLSATLITGEHIQGSGFLLPEAEGLSQISM